MAGGQGLKAFLSHNTADKKPARALAQALVAFGVDPWFDEWSIAPGESIVGGLERGVGECRMFILIWSKAAAASKWVDTEVRAFLRRRVDDPALRIVPIMLDDEPLPSLVAEYRGFELRGGAEIATIAYEIVGKPCKDTVVKLLHALLLEKLHGHKDLAFQPLAIFCEQCYSTDLRHGTTTDDDRGDTYYSVECQDCGWSDATEI
jgi:hypothetical protein